ncbi:hypothetical protein FLM55_08740 [Francisella sp. Scap27]|uniref:YiiX/YebB-like N1pC/P60 family cysteine hydrolase n=1 Tax=Francisella sp. Scap27 TaxID=2589986 RepID=UPI0015BB8A6C|nr:YiiX/YebB-like N1pC/P60 family cysteine hydrolase [Francisella sp. Scap27]QLE79811.1 hypothetical protein FLM55_08740 [Francisella sp. Scap27]
MSTLKPKKLIKGDVIFIANESEENISSLSSGFSGVSFYHCGIYIGDNKIIEAVTYQGVIEANLDKYKSNKKLVARTDLDSYTLERIISKAKSFIGFKYNDFFLPNQDKALYCSELIHEAFARTLGKPYFQEQTLNYYCLETHKISDYWQNLYAEQGLEVPQGEKGSHPNNLSLDEKFIEKFITC